MKNKSTMNFFEYLLKYLIYGFFTLVCYNAYLFRCLNGKTYNESKRVFLIILLFSFILGIIAYRKRKTNWSVALCVLGPFGLYTLLAYAKTAKIFIIISTSIAITLALVYTVYNLIRKMKSTTLEIRKETLKSQTRQCAYILSSLVILSFTVIMVTISVGTFFGTSLLKSDVEPVQGTSEQAQTINGNMNKILLLQEDEWEKLDVKEKLSVMQAVANIEAHYLGLPNELNVGTKNLGKDTLGNYNDDTHTININLDSLENDQAEEILEACCHEAYHSYQYRLVDAYNSADESSKSLSIFRKAATYNDEFDDGAPSNFKDYYSQNCEKDARDYSEDAVYDYYSRIDEYLQKKA